MLAGAHPTMDKSLHLQSIKYLAFFELNADCYCINKYHEEDAKEVIYIVMLFVVYSLFYVHYACMV